MKNASRFWAILVLIATVVIACTSLKSIEVGGETALGKGDIKVLFSDPPRELELLELPPGTENVDITFFDKGGNALGSTKFGVSEGDTLGIPVGTGGGMITGGGLQEPVYLDSNGRVTDQVPVNTPMGAIGGQLVPMQAFAHWFPVTFEEDTSSSTWSSMSNKSLTMHLDNPGSKWTHDLIVQKAMTVLQATDPTTVKMGKWEVDSFHFITPVSNGLMVQSYDNIVPSEWTTYDLIVNGTTLPQNAVVESYGWTTQATFVSETLVNFPGFNHGNVHSQTVDDPTPTDWQVQALAN